MPLVGGFLNPSSFPIWQLGFLNLPTHGKKKFDENEEAI